MSNRIKATIGSFSVDVDWIGVPAQCGMPSGFYERMFKGTMTNADHQWHAEAIKSFNQMVADVLNTNEQLVKDARKRLLSMLMAKVVFE